MRSANYNVSMVGGSNGEAHITDIRKKAAEDILCGLLLKRYNNLIASVDPRPTHEAVCR